MAQAHSILAVIVWIVILIVCFAIFLYLFADTLKQFLAFGKLVQLQVYLFNKKVDFYHRNLDGSGRNGLSFCHDMQH